ncbi:lamin tail domain-containing protein [Streptomyces durhamensis]|uniref:lamin tail domain-containing protein n=1 Tax=Streptomyces durhamensis TaxID=68194 RepID=UPI0007C6D471|nr:lamin tail domain-containing protein [Streptomyces durhamensis]
MSASSSVRRTTAVAAAATALVGAVTLPAAAAGHRPVRPHAVVFISGVQHDRLVRNDRSPRSLNEQWVDITNDSRRPVSLDNWTLTDRDGHVYTFSHTRLAGRATVRVHTGAGRDTRTDLYQDRRTRVWDVNSDTATLRDARGRFVDSVSWGHDRHDGTTDRRDAAARHQADPHRGLDGRRHGLDGHRGLDGHHHALDGHHDRGHRH